MYMMAKGIDEQPESKKLATFLWLIGQQAMEIYNTLYPNDGTTNGILGIMQQQQQPAAQQQPTAQNQQPAAQQQQQPAVQQQQQQQVDGQQQRTLNEVLDAFEQYCIPRKNITMESFKFNTILKLLDGHNETLASVIEKCKTFEAAYVNKIYLDRNAKTSNVCSVDQAAKETSTTVAAIARKCYNCGGPFTPTHLRVCKANGVTCNACGRVGHFSQWCKQQDKKDGQPHGNKTGQQQSHKEGQNQKVNKENKCLSINWNNE
ncbi:hypothetical protein ACLKA6_001865 [Drosophila palustris]